MPKDHCEHSTCLYNCAMLLMYFWYKRAKADCAYCLIERNMILENRRIISEIDGDDKIYNYCRS